MSERPDAPRDESELPNEEELIEGVSQAISTAIRGLHERGIATNHLIDGRLVRVHPDGHREDLGPLESL